LDFHTSEQIPGIGSEFDPERFAHRLKAASVDSVTVFSRCHHGMIYHDTKFPAKHPFLTCNLLAEQIQACHAADIRCPIYISVGLDEFQTRLHPEWIEVFEDGRPNGAKPLDAGWHKLDFASPYLDYVIAQTEEVLDMFGDECDGLFFDIIHVGGVHSRYCLAEYDRLGLDPARPEHQKAMQEHVMGLYLNRVTDAVRAKKKDCPIFHNSGHIAPSFRENLRFFSHLEVESLPTGGWGYMHFPVTARYARSLGLDYLGMTGKFSETWGHFNSYKPQAALDYECFLSLALAGKCSVGDQLHPSGELDETTYELIGNTYREVAAKEPWCIGARAVAEIGILNGEAFVEGGNSNDANLGASRMLIEARHQFDVIDTAADFSKYRLLVLPDVVEVDVKLRQKLEQFVADGGAIIASHRSGLSPEGKFEISDFPAVYEGELRYSPDFLQPADSVGLGNGVYVMYEKGIAVKATEGAEPLATIFEPYFNRTYRHFCSHNHTPPKGTSGQPGALIKGRIAYFSHPVFSTYAQHSMLFHRDLVLRALDRLMPDPLVTVNGPSTLQANVTAQDGEKRIVLHLLHYIPERRGRRLDIVEDVIPLFDLKVSMALEGSPKVTLVPQGTELDTRLESGKLTFNVPRVDGHQMVAIDYA
jgi:hypothetical protein